MDLHMSSLATLVPEGQKDLELFYATRYQVYWGLTYVDFCQYCTDLISHTHKDTQHTQWPVDWHTHINIYLHHHLSAYSSDIYNNE